MRYNCNMSQRMDLQRVQIKLVEYSAVLQEVLGNIAEKDMSIEGKHAAEVLGRKLREAGSGGEAPAAASSSPGDLKP